MLGPALAVFVITAQCLPAITIRNFVSLLLIRHRNYTAYQGTQSEVIYRDHRGLWFCFYQS